MDLERGVERDVLWAGGNPDCVVLSHGKERGALDYMKKMEVLYCSLGIDQLCDVFIVVCMPERRRIVRPWLRRWWTMDGE